MIYNSFGRAAVRFAIAYVRRRYRREIRLGAGGLLAVFLGLIAYLATRDVPEG